MSDRMLQVNEKIQHALAEIFSLEAEIPKEYFISVTKVDCTADLRHAKVFVSILPFNKSQEGLDWLIENRKLIQGFFGNKIKLKYTPILKFVIDESEQKAEEIYTIMDNL